MTIGDIDLGVRPVLLAPMEDVTDASFRGICREQGADMVYTEFIPSEGLIRDAKKAYAKLKTSDDEAPVGIQIYGSDPDAMVEAAKMADHAPELVGGHGCDVIDINFGCPVSKIAGRGAGSGMMKDPDKMVMITKRIVEAVASRSRSRPVSAGTRAARSSWNWPRGFRTRASRHSRSTVGRAARCTRARPTGHSSGRSSGTRGCIFL